MGRELSLMERLARLPIEARLPLRKAIPATHRSRVARSWDLTARPSQLSPEGDWSVWLILAGRCFAHRIWGGVVAFAQSCCPSWRYWKPRSL